MKSEKLKKGVKKDSSDDGVLLEPTGEELEEIRKKSGVGAVIIKLKEHYEGKLVKFIGFKIKDNCFDPESHKFEIKDKVFESAEKKIHKCEQIDIISPPAWLISIAWFKIRDHFNSTKDCWDLPRGSTISRDACDQIPADSTDTDWAVRQELGFLVRQALENLQIKDRVIILYRLDGYTYPEIAKMMGIEKEGTAKRQGLRAARKFQEILEKLGIKVG